MNEKDVISLDYDLWLVESNELYDTTREGTAKENDIFDEERTYSPITTIVGAGRLIKGLEDSLLQAEVEKEMEVEIPPEQAYGVRNPKLVELHGMREILRLPEFKKGEAEPYVGMELVFKGKPAYIAGMTAGRVRIDFNHKLAGRTLKYKYTITKKYEGEERISAVIDADYGRSGDFKVTVDGEDATVVLPEICKYDQNWLVAKYRIVSDLRDVLGLKKISFVEEYVKKEEPKEEEKAEGEGEEEKAEAPEEEGSEPEKEE